MTVTLVTTLLVDLANYCMISSFGSQIGFNKVNFVFIEPPAAARRVLRMLVCLEIGCV